LDRLSRKKSTLAPDPALRQAQKKAIALPEQDCDRSPKNPVTQQYQDIPRWDVSLPDRRELLGQIQWIQEDSRILPNLGKFAIVNINRQPVTPAAIFDTWQDAVVELHFFCNHQAIASLGAA
jgi:hypothetical protein